MRRRHGDFAMSRVDSVRILRNQNYLRSARVDEDASITLNSPGEIKMMVIPARVRLYDRSEIGLTTKFLPLGYTLRKAANPRVSNLSGFHLHSMASAASRPRGTTKSTSRCCLSRQK